MTAPRLSTTDHVGYVVADLDAAQASFERLGFSLLGRAELEAFGLEVAMLANGEQKAELLRVLDPEQDRARRGSSSLRLDHVAYRVGDIEAEMAALVAAGAELTGPDDRPLEQPLELAGSRHLWAKLGEIRLQLVQ